MLHSKIYLEIDQDRYKSQDCLSCWTNKQDTKGIFLTKYLSHVEKSNIDSCW